MAELQLSRKHKPAEHNRRHKGITIGNTIGNIISNTIGNTIGNSIGNTIGNYIKNTDFEKVAF